MANGEDLLNVEGIRNIKYPGRRKSVLLLYRMWRNLQKLKKNKSLDNKLFDSSDRKLRLWLITQPRKILFVMKTHKKRNRLLDEK